jgi:hypothetical protein
MELRFFIYRMMDPIFLKLPLDCLVLFVIIPIIFSILHKAT